MKQAQEPERFYARVYWLDTLTGNSGVYEDSYPSLWREAGDSFINPFMWEDGNWSCDCNRELFFLGTPMEDTTCGDERFKVLRLEARIKGVCVDSGYSELEEIK